MNISRQHLLLGLLAIIGFLQVGDWVLSSMIQGPLRERRARTNQLNKDIAKRESLLKETRKAGEKITAWQKKSLPAHSENTLCKSQLMELRKKLKECLQI